MVSDRPHGFSAFDFRGQGQFHWKKQRHLTAFRENIISKNSFLAHLS
jgi:hypothetical protein